MKLININWLQISKKEELENSFTFWSKVYQYKNAVGQLIFREVAEYVLTLLTLPSSNAVVERAFSVMNCIKTKSRNKMNKELLSAILRIRMSFFALKICCQVFQPSKTMLKDFTSHIMYPHQYEFDNQETEEQETGFDEALQEFDWPCVHIPD